MIALSLRFAENRALQKKSLKIGQGFVVRRTAGVEHQTQLFLAQSTVSNYTDDEADLAASIFTV